MPKFLIHSLSPWDFQIGSNIRDIANELSKNHQVIYLNIPVKYTELLSGQLPWIKDRKVVAKTKKPRIQKINDNLVVATTPVFFYPVNKLPSFVFDFFNKVNNKKYCRSITQIVEEQHFEDYIVINDNDIYSGFHFPEFLESRQSIYYLRDFMTAMPYWSANANRLEPELMKKYDLIMSNSLYLRNYAAKYNDNSYYVGQGCDVDRLKEKPAENQRPEELNLNGYEKIVGYVGELTSWRLDIDLIEYIAKDNPSYLFVLVGNEDESFLNSNLHSLENVLFTGKKPFELLGNYLYAFDVCINPQKVNQVTVGNYPRKIDEYLTVGKPTVATHTETMVAFEEVTYLAKTPKEYSELIRKAIKEDNDDKTIQRKKVGQSHNWENSVNEMLRVIEELNPSD